MSTIPKGIPGYDYGSEGVQRSALTAADWASLMDSLGYSDEDVANLLLAGEVLLRTRLADRGAVEEQNHC